MRSFVAAAVVRPRATKFGRDDECIAPSVPKGKDGTNEYERKLQQHSARHGFLFGQSEHGGSVLFTRAA